MSCSCTFPAPDTCTKAPDVFTRLFKIGPLQTSDAYFEEPGEKGKSTATNGGESARADQRWMAYIFPA